MEFWASGLYVDDAAVCVALEGEGAKGVVVEDLVRWRALSDPQPWETFRMMVRTRARRLALQEAAGDSVVGGTPEDRSLRALARAALAGAVKAAQAGKTSVVDALTRTAVNAQRERTRIRGRRVE